MVYNFITLHKQPWRINWTMKFAHLTLFSLQIFCNITNDLKFEQQQRIIFLNLFKFYLCFLVVAV